MRLVLSGFLCLDLIAMGDITGLMTASGRGHPTVDSMKAWLRSLEDTANAQLTLSGQFKWMLAGLGHAVFIPNGYITVSIVLNNEPCLGLRMGIVHKHNLTDLKLLKCIYARSGDAYASCCRSIDGAFKLMCVQAEGDDDEGANSSTTGQQASAAQAGETSTEKVASEVSSE